MRNVGEADKWYVDDLCDRPDAQSNRKYLYILYGDDDMLKQQNMTFSNEQLRTVVLDLILVSARRNR